MSIFSIDTIKTSTVKFQKENSHHEDLNISFFIESLNKILYEQQEIDNMIFASDILTENIVTDTFFNYLKKIDPIKILKRVFEGFINIIDSLFKKFESLMLNLFNNDHIIKLNKAKLMSVDSDEKFSTMYYPKDRFQYTNIILSQSYTNFKNDTDKEISSLLINLSKFNKFNTYEKLITSLEKIKNEMNDGGLYLNTLRGYIVGKQDPIDKNDFAIELFDYFRNRGNKILAGNISTREIKETAMRYFNYNISIKSLQKENSDIKNQSKKMQKEIGDIKLENFVKSNIPEEALQIFVRILEDKIRRVKDICDIYVQTMGAKLDAYKESYKQDRDILFYACKALVKGEI